MVVNPYVFSPPNLTKFQYPLLCASCSLNSQDIEIDFIECRISDHSALEALHNLVSKYHKEGKKVKLKHLSEDCQVLLFKASPLFKEVIVADIDDPRYYVLSGDFAK